MALTPILVAGSGRSGTTAIMAQFGTDSRIAFDRVYPYENRYLTYLAKFAVLAGRQGDSSHHTSDEMCSFKNGRFGAVPWPTQPLLDGRLAPATADWLRNGWRCFEDNVRVRQPGATHYAEKAPAWLPAALRSATPVKTIYLVRDPRDVFLSANAFNARRGSLSFGRQAGDTDRDHAQNLAFGWLQYFENQRDDVRRRDSLTIRFEDLITDRAGTIHRLGETLGLDLTPDDSAGTEHLAIHQTSETVAATVGRWQREPIDGAAHRLMETLLADAMQFNGYPLSARAEQPQSIDLRRAATQSPDGTLSIASDGGVLAEITGPDFWMETPPIDRPAQEFVELWACVRADVGEHFSLYWCRAGEEFDEARSVHSQFYTGEHWQILRLHAAKHEHWHGRITRLRFDLSNNPNGSGRCEVRWIRAVPAG